MIPAVWMRARVWNAAGELLHNDPVKFREVTRAGYRTGQHKRLLRVLQRRYAGIWRRIDIEPLEIA